MALAFTMLVYLRPNYSILPRFEEWISNPVSKPDCANKRKQHNAEHKGSDERSNYVELKNEQKNQPDNHSVHFFAGLDDQSSRTHNKFPFLDLTITPFPHSPLTLWGGL
jgi:hypothetical protein